MVMEAIDGKTGRKYIERLENLLGKDWCNTELEKYKEFQEKYSPYGMWSHRQPMTPPIVPLLFQYKHPESRQHQAIPLGYWYGEPILYLVPPEIIIKIRLAVMFSLYSDNRLPFPSAS